MIWIASIIGTVAGAVVGRWLMRQILGISDAPSGRSLAHNVLASTADKRVTGQERDRLRAEAFQMLDGTVMLLPEALESTDERFDEFPVFGSVEPIRVPRPGDLPRIELRHYGK